MVGKEPAQDSISDATVSFPGASNGHDTDFFHAGLAAPRGARRERDHGRSLGAAKRPRGEAYAGWPSIET